MDNFPTMRSLLLLLIKDAESKGDDNILAPVEYVKELIARVPVDRSIDYAWFTNASGDYRSKLEMIGDLLEGIARIHQEEMPDDRRKSLFGVGWEVKQIARQNTPSHGV